MISRNGTLTRHFVQLKCLFNEPHFGKLLSTLVFVALYFQRQLKDSEELLEGNCLYAQTLGSLMAGNLFRSEFPVPAAVSEIGNISFILLTYRNTFIGLGSVLAIHIPT